MSTYALSLGKNNKIIPIFQKKISKEHSQLHCRMVTPVLWWCVSKTLLE